MKNQGKKKKSSIFENFALSVSKATGSTYAFTIALLLVIIWAATGPSFDYSETWQLVINTSTTIITFLMVFLIQKAQNKDSLSIQLKLDELVAAHDRASNRLVNVEDMTEDELKVIQKYYIKLSELTKNDHNIQESHSIDEAEEQSQLKNSMRHQLKDKKEQGKSKKVPSKEKNAPIKDKSILNKKKTVQTKKENSQATVVKKTLPAKKSTT